MDHKKASINLQILVQSMLQKNNINNVHKSRNNNNNKLHGNIDKNKIRINKNSNHKEMINKFNKSLFMKILMQKNHNNKIIQRVILQQKIKEIQNNIKIKLEIEV